jgi:small GTP-binding protein
MQRLVHNEFSEAIQSTIGVEFRSIELPDDQELIRLHIWDTAGQEKFRSVSKAYFRNSVGAALVFALNDSQSFQNLDPWLSDLQQLALPNAVIILVGNKADLTSERQITEDQAKDFADRHNLDYIETSARTSAGVRDAFVRLVRRIGEKRAKGEIKGDFKTTAPRIGVPVAGNDVRQREKPACDC